MIVKLAFMLLIIAGLIFRTKETFGFLMICGILTFWGHFPWFGTFLVGSLIIYGIYNVAKGPSNDPVVPANNSAALLGGPDNQTTP